MDCSVYRHLWIRTLVNEIKHATVIPLPGCWATQLVRAEISCFLRLGPAGRDWLSGPVFPFYYQEEPLVAGYRRGCGFRHAAGTPAYCSGGHTRLTCICATIAELNGRVAQRALYSLTRAL